MKSKYFVATKSRCRIIELIDLSLFISLDVVSYSRAVCKRACVFFLLHTDSLSSNTFDPCALHIH